MKKQLIFSVFLSFQDKRNKLVIFNKLYPVPVYITKKEWKSFKINHQNNKKLLKLFLKTKIIINSKKEDKDLLYNYIDKQEKILNKPSTLYLVLTKNCNLKCRYCLVDQSCDMMSTRVARKGIRLWANNFKNNEKCFIVFYGGEPILNIETFIDSLKYIDNLKKKNRISKKVSIILSTNGILIKQELLKVLKKYKVYVVVGLDGKRKPNDFYRKDKNNKGTFLKTIEIIKILQKNKIKTGISTAITPKNAKEANNLSLFLKKYKIKEFGFNVLRGKDLKFLSSEKNRKEYYNKVAKVIINNYLNSKNTGVVETQMKKRITSFKNKACLIDCGGYGNQIVIQPNGDISNCPFLNNKLFNIKNIKNKLIINSHAIIKAWRKRLPLYDKKCLDCDAVSICGGGCPWNAKETNKDFIKKDNSVCIINKKIFNLLIWSKI